MGKFVNAIIKTTQNEIRTSLSQGRAPTCNWSSSKERTELNSKYLFSYLPLVSIYNLNGEMFYYKEVKK